MQDHNGNPGFGEVPPLPKVYPLLPLRDIVVYPHMVVPLFVGRDKSIKALEEAMSKDKDLLVAAQRQAKTNNPNPEDIYQVGTMASIIQMLRLPDGTIKLLIEGKQRAKIVRYLDNKDFFQVEVLVIKPEYGDPKEVEALMRGLHNTFEVYVKLNKKVPPEMLHSVAAIDDPERLADTVAAHLGVKLEEKQKILGSEKTSDRLREIYELIQGEIEILQIEKRIRNRVKKQMEKTQKEYYLNEQMQAIQKELGDKDEFRNELNEIEEKIKKKRMSKEATAKVKKELKKLKMMSPMSAEATVVRNYIDWVLGLPWFETTKDKLDLDEAAKILDEDHYGLKKPKERILEYLAVQSLVEKSKGPILCFVGPPGVGKTSLGKSIARATARRFVRLSLGGVRDEAEIRGHRRTYIGALPGKIIQHMKKAGSNNPVFLLDEVDKMSSDWRGDPAAALLEALDPEQNHQFQDHYLDVDYDLSKTMFITTANTLNGIPPALQDRMEIIHLPGYTDAEKMEIAKRHLVPKQKEANGITDIDMVIKTSALQRIMDQYTREAGVRNLEREIGNICRKIAIRVVKEGKDKRYSVDAKGITKFLGVPRYRRSKNEEEPCVGLSTGLAWTEHGGELLLIEVAVTPGKGKLTITGKLGEVMQESAKAAVTYVRSRAVQLGLDPKFHEEVDLHIHVPEGAIPKDGPSAGITMAVALASALTGIKVRRDVAMTGEITLRGRVLPIGGVKEKSLAAYRTGIKQLIMPADNKKDLPDVPAKIRRAIHFIFVEHVDEVLKNTLVLDDPEHFFKKVRSAEGQGGNQGKIKQPGNEDDVEQAPPDRREGPGEPGDMRVVN
ncbi:MAG: endopeptidase La [Deltaproteobacteria bacterium]|nr:endopeptidase La [Deltaproteobacteria bacterium]